VQLQLDNDQAAVLQDVLESTLGDLRMEISNTDNAQFRRGLRAREDTLRTILAELRNE
jgi:hypothetical protein